MKQSPKGYKAILQSKEWTLAKFLIIFHDSIPYFLFGCVFGVAIISSMFGV